jgi:hypothetical protein
VPEEFLVGERLALGQALRAVARDLRPAQALFVLAEVEAEAEAAEAEAEAEAELADPAVRWEARSRAVARDRSLVVAETDGAWARAARA